MKNTVTRKINCKVCGSDVFKPEIELNEKGEFVKTWECGCCSDVTPRKARVSKKQKETQELFAKMFG